MSNTFPNNLFISFLREKEKEARQNNDRSHYEYKLALVSLLQCSETLPNGKACQQLDNIGPDIADMLDEALIQHNRQLKLQALQQNQSFGQYPPGFPPPQNYPQHYPQHQQQPHGYPPHFHPQNQTQTQTQNQSQNQNQPYFHPPPPLQHYPPPMYHQPQYGNAQFPNQNPVPPVNETLTQNDHTAAGALENFEDEFGTLDSATSPKSKSSTSKQPRPYHPNTRSGAFGILLALYVARSKKTYPGYLTKEQIIEIGQKYCDASYTISERGNGFTAWHGINTLLLHEMVRNVDAPTKYDLTPKGEEKAKGFFDTLVEQEKEVDEERKAIAEQKKTPPKKRSIGDLFEPPNDPNQRVSLSPKSPTSIDSPFQFFYISSEGSKVKSKDDAQVDLNENDILFKIEYPNQPKHQFLSKVQGQKKKENESFIYIGYLKDEDAPQSCPGYDEDKLDGVKDEPLENIKKELARETPTKKRQLPRSVTELTPKTTLPQDMPPILTRAESDPIGEPDNIQYEIIKFEPYTFDVVLIVDDRDFKALNEKEKLVKTLEQNEIKFERRILPVGNFIWVARNKNGVEIVLSHIVERTRLDDFVVIVNEGRFKEKKARLSESGLDNVIYIIEEKKTYETLKFEIEPTRTRSAIVETQVQDDFFVRQSFDFADTTGYLSLLTFLFEEDFKKQKLFAIDGNMTSSQFSELKKDLKEKSNNEYFLTFNLFSTLNTKDAHLTIKQSLQKQLEQIKSVGPQRAAAITELYPTLPQLLSAFEKYNGHQKEDLLANIKFDKKRVGIAASKKIYQLLCLPEYPK